jgi:hypothetical protein
MKGETCKRNNAHEHLHQERRRHLGRVVDYGNLRRDSVEDRSEETIEFLYEYLADDPRKVFRYSSGSITARINAQPRLVTM